MRLRCSGELHVLMSECVTPKVRPVVWPMPPGPYIYYPQASSVPHDMRSSPSAHVNPVPPIYRPAPRDSNPLPPFRRQIDQPAGFSLRKLFSRRNEDEGIQQPYGTGSTQSAYYRTPILAPSQPSISGHKANHRTFYPTSNRGF